jgi:hypothetical protein
MGRESRHIAPSSPPFTGTPTTAVLVCPVVGGPRDFRLKRFPCAPHRRYSLWTGRHSALLGSMCPSSFLALRVFQPPYLLCLQADAAPRERSAALIIAKVWVGVGGNERDRERAPMLKGTMRGTESEDPVYPASPLFSQA